MVKRFKKKQVKIEAIQWNGNNIYEVVGFCKGAQEWKPNLQDDERMGPLYINTLEGKVKTNIGDYIIQGVKGEFYPISEKKFNEIYEHYCESTYIKRPLEVEAVQYNGDLRDLDGFCYIYKYNENKKLMVRTEYGNWLEASDGDYIVCEGEGYHPVKPDIFMQTYEEVGYVN